MRRTASEKMEIIRLVEGTELPVRATLRQMNIPRSTFYKWYQRYEMFGFDGLHDKKPAPRPCWTAVPKKVQKQLLDLALERTDLSPRELACRYTDESRYFVSESSVYRILKAADLISAFTPPPRSEIPQPAEALRVLQLRSLRNPPSEFLENPRRTCV